MGAAGSWGSSTDTSHHNATRGATLSSAAPMPNPGVCSLIHCVTPTSANAASVTRKVTAAAATLRRSRSTGRSQATACTARSTFAAPTPAVYTAHTASGTRNHRPCFDCRAAVCTESAR